MNSRINVSLYILSLLASLLYPDTLFAAPEHQHNHDRQEQYAGQHLEQAAEHHSETHDKLGGAPRGHGSKSDSEHAHSPGDTLPELELSNEQIEEFSISLQSAGPGEISQYIEAAGEVVANDETLSHISARFPGIVKEVKKRIGDTVEPGDVLAVVESNESLSSYPLRSEIRGTIIAKHASYGELLKVEDIAYTVANLETVWINFNIYQDDLPRVAVNQTVSISQGHGQAQAQSSVHYVSPVIDPHTRTATLRCIMDNSSGEWVPGAFVTGQIEVETKTAAIAVSPLAIHSIENRPAVFVKTSQGFRPRFVSLGDRSRDLVEIQGGLIAGEIYAAKNSFVLKAELEKDEFGDGHNH